jgi:hypothetical protein
MTISSVSATASDSFLSRLETNGLSASKAQLVEDDLSQVESSSGSTGSSSSSIDMQTMRAALDAKIDEDVSSGKLSETDAAAVRKTLDQMGGQTDDTGTTGQSSAATTKAAATQSEGAAQTGASGGATGGGAGGSTAKTEVSETVTINGPLKTTVITYSDGSTQTTTTVATETDEQKYGKQQASQDAAATANAADTSAASNAGTNTAAMKYLSTLAPGTLFSQMA